MGKTKNKSHSEIEYLRGLVKELKKENGQLRRQLKESTKLGHMYEDVVEEYEELIAEQEVEEVIKVARCPECHAGALNLVLDLNDKDIYACGSCTFKKVVRK